MILTGGSSGTREDVRAFQRKSKLRSTIARSTVFDWLAPAETIDFEDHASTDLRAPNGAELGPEREDYDHEEPGTLSGYRSDGLDPDAVARQVTLRRKLHQRDALRFVGTTTAMQLRPGVRFELLNHSSPDFDRHYLVVGVEHSAGDRINPDYPDEAYTNRIECVPIEVEWRPERKTRRPRMPSMQTARVVGPPSEEIYTDEHGRIKVQFHWDRRKHDDEGASCFIRVVQPWAGNGWGSTFLPRIGMEVAVTFIDGDPDRPVVTGCLYNGQNTPPYALPDDKTKSTIKTQSSPGGGGFNELRFEDAAGGEEIYIHAQKDFNETVLYNHSTTVGNNQTNEVAVNQSQVVRGDQKETVDGNQSVSVGRNRTVKVAGKDEETVDGAKTRMVSGDVTDVFMSCENRAIAGDQDEVIGGDERHSVSGNREEMIMGSLSQSVTGGVDVRTPGTYNVTADGGMTMTAKGG
jgi:type VI secretion system secreted protein VgrG